MQVGKVGTYEPICIQTTWTIPLTDLLICDTGEYVESAPFSTFHDETEIKWHLRIYPKGSSTTTKENISVNLVGQCDLHITAKVSFSSWLYCNNINKSYNLENNEIGVKVLCTRELVFNNLIPKGDTSFSLSCTISITNMKSEAEENVKGLNYFRSREHVSFEKLLDCEQFSDVTFNIDGTKVYGHKSLLASRSPVFAAMFQNGMMESSSKVVNIEDIDPEVFREMLRYFYSAKVNNIDKFAMQLLHVADMYVINGLKYLCEEVLSAKLNLENVLEYFTMAEKYNAAKLKAQTVNFMKVNAKEIIDRPDFKSSNAVFEVLKMVLGIRAPEAKDVSETVAQ